MSDNSIIPFAVCAAAAAIASSVELGNTYSYSPFADRKLCWRWFCIVALDGCAGIAALAVIRAFNWPERASWLSGALGWVAVGVVAALVVRADLLKLPLGAAKIPVGFGIVYGTIRSLLDKDLWKITWELQDADLDGRLKWSLDTADKQNKATQLEFAKFSKKLLGYASADAAARTSRESEESTQKARLAIESAEKNLPADELQAVKQLITFMVSEGYYSPLNRLLGRPSRKETRRWRSAPA